MNALSILTLGLAMSTDAFAAALAKGTAMEHHRWRTALRIGAVFGLVEALTPLLGWWLGSLAVHAIEDYDHWVAFTLLAGLGLHMMYHARASPSTKPAAALPADNQASSRQPLWSLALAGLATSIDALAVGVGLAFVQVHILVVSAVIGLCTFVMVTLGIMAGKALGVAFGRRASLCGGALLIGIGLAIVYEHSMAQGL